MSEFRKRLEKAVDRGLGAEAERRAGEEAALRTEAALRKRHDALHAEALDRLGDLLREVREVLGGFGMRPVADADGEGYALTRTDEVIGPSGAPERSFSRVEARLLPFDKRHRLEISLRAVIRNQEKPKRTFSEPVDALDPKSVEDWAQRALVRYAEDFADDDESRGE